MASGRNDVLRSGTVTIESGDKIYTVGYDVLKGGVVKLDTGQSTHRSDTAPEQIARWLLTEIIDSGEADRQSLGRPKPTVS